jgi:hypothetical protein
MRIYLCHKAKWHRKQSGILGNLRVRPEVLAKQLCNIFSQMGSPIDVANAALFFASNESGYITGGELHINGRILAEFVAIEGYTVKKSLNPPKWVIMADGCCSNPYKKA